MSVDPTTNGHGHPNGTTSGTPHAHHATTDVVQALRLSTRPPLLFRGFGPLVVGLVLVVAMLWLAPSVAPEHIVQRPATDTVVTTTVVTPPPPSTTAEVTP